MSLTNTPFRLALITLILCAPLTWSSNVQDQLASEYIGKTLTLRHFYSGDHLAFRADGTLDGTAPLGPWTVDGKLVIDEIKLHKSTLVVRGRRLILVFDSKSKTFQDYLVTLKDYREKNRDDIERFVRKRMVDVEISLPSEKPDAQQVASAMQAVFLTANESMVDLAPAHWRSYFERKEHRPPKPQDASQPVYSLSGNDGIVRPRITFDPEPDYSDTARQVKWQGTVLLSLVVEPTGTIRDIQIDSPLGAGLDEKSVEAVNNWKFDPAQKDGRPVPVAIKVEVTFHLY
jgi:TonB family protein